MCQIILLKNGDELETISDVETFFNQSLLKYKETYYKSLDKDSCLCQINLDSFMSDKKDRFTNKGIFWVEN